MVGLFIVAMIGLSVIYDLWMLLDIKRGLSMVNHIDLTENLTNI